MQEEHVQWLREKNEDRTSKHREAPKLSKSLGSLKSVKMQAYQQAQNGDTKASYDVQFCILQNSSPFQFLI